MQRRSNLSQSKEVGTNLLHDASKPSQSHIRSPSQLAPSRTNNSTTGPSTACLLLIAVLLTAATYMIPEIQYVEQEAKHAEQVFEQDIRNWWEQHGEQQAPGADASSDTARANDNVRRAAASERMLAHDSKWVDGEKKLKARLQVLAARQAQGLDLGVPVATRWVGDDIPAWLEENNDKAKADWEAQIAARYEQMRKEEAHWRDMVAATMQKERG